MAPQPLLKEAKSQPGCCTTKGCDVWTDEQFLGEKQATGFYLNQQSGNLGFILGGGAARLFGATASVVSALLFALYAF
jgi:hypothetical protein